MRNIFDQYDAPENQLTHALGCCLQHDRRLLKQFVIWVTGRRNLNWRRLKVLEQQVPGVPQRLLLEEETKGLPDLWIHGDGDWSLIVESKVAAKLTADQLKRHRRTAERNGFADIALVALVPAAPAQQSVGIFYLTWAKVYSWLRKRAKESLWAGYMAEFLEVAEVRMTASGYLGDHVLTEFDGIPFGKDHPYSYREAKRLLKLALAMLRQRNDLKTLGMNPNGPGRPAITGRDDSSVWDFLPLTHAQGAANFTKFPHLTLSIQAQRTVVIVTLPHAVSATLRQNLVAGGFEAFRGVVADVERRVSKAIRQAKLKHAFPHLEVVQRHYTSQRSAPINDASLVFDLRTAVGSNSSAVKHQPQWLEATYNALVKKHSNLQLGIGAVFPYDDGRLHSKNVLDAIAGVWIGCDPWIQAILHGM